MISLYDILEAADGQLFGEPVAQLFTDFCHDARKARDGELYVALKTEHGDGHSAMQEAVTNGAAGIMCTRPPAFDAESLTVIVVRSVEDALLRWSRIVLQKYGTTVIGVTGSVGKSTAQQAIAHVLRQKHSVYTHAGSIDGRFGVPLALGKLTPDHRFAVLEFGTNRPGEMAEMVALARPLVGVMLAVQHAHTDRLTSLEAIAREKGDLVRSLPPQGLAVLNFDDPHVRPLVGETQAAVLTVGLDIAEPAFGADLLAYNSLVDRYKTGFDLRHGVERYPGRWVPLLGAHQLYSVLAALAVGMSYDIAAADGLAALTEFDPLPGRMHPFEGPHNSLVIDDTVSATPEGVGAVLNWIAQVKDARTRAILVLGEMDGLGGFAATAHSQVGQRAAGVVDRLVTLGELAADSGRAAIEAGMHRDDVVLTFNPGDAARAAARGLDEHAIVVVKGGELARMERVVRELFADSRDAVKLARQTGLHDAVTVNRPEHTSWVQIDLQAIAHNARRMQAIVGDDVALMAVVKANAYGHGAVEVSTTVLNNGAAYLEVASLHEALDLREAGIDAPILIGGYVPPWTAREVIHHDLTITLFSIEQARAFDRAAAGQDATIRAHVKIDSGMGMLGLLPDEVTLFFRGVRTLRHLVIEGVYTEFSASHVDADHTRRQLEVFRAAIEPLGAAGYDFVYTHAADSAAALHFAASRFNMVRAGIALYGVHPGAIVPLPADFKPALEWKTLVAQVKQLPRGHYVGDSNTYRAPDTRRIALLPVGFADGLRRGPLHWQHVLIRGQVAPVVGQIGMDVTAVDVTHSDGVEPGDEVVLVGTQGEHAITVEDVAHFLDTSPYEVLTTILARVPRVT